MTHSDQFKPRCLTGQCLGHSNKGYLVPCCYVDAFYDNAKDGVGIRIHYDNDKLNALFDPSLKISNNDHIHDITMSDKWMDFYTMLQDESQEKPLMCIKVCDPSYSRDFFKKEDEQNWMARASARGQDKKNPAHIDRRRSTEMTHMIKINRPTAATHHSTISTEDEVLDTRFDDSDNS